MNMESGDNPQKGLSVQRFVFWSSLVIFFILVIPWTISVSGIKIMGKSLLQWAIQSKNKGLTVSLIKTGAKVNVRDNDGRTPLHYAVENNQTEITRLLLDKKADINAQDNDGTTPLHIASSMGYQEIVQL